MQGGHVESDAWTVLSNRSPLVVFREVNVLALLVVPPSRRSERRGMQLDVVERKA